MYSVQICSEMGLDDQVSIKLSVYIFFFCENTQYTDISVEMDLVRDRKKIVFYSILW